MFAGTALCVASMANVQSKRRCLQYSYMPLHSPLAWELCFGQHALSSGKFNSKTP